MNKNELTQQLEKHHVPYCFNEQHYDFDKLKFIIVGDNPGKTEYIENKFFIGPSGQELRRHFSKYDLSQNFDEECIIYNKTFIHTPKTKDLQAIQEKIGDELFDATQIQCAEEVAEVANRLKLPILIFGKSSIGPKQLFDAFWQSLNQKVNNSEKVWVFNHPSPPYLQFQKEWKKYAEQVPQYSSSDLLKHIGKINTQKIKSKYPKPEAPQTGSLFDDF